MSLAALGLLPLVAAPFHEDEAAYAAWSLAILRGDPLLWATPIDKPPLTLYPMAGSVALFGRHEWAARLPNLLWSLGLLALVGRIARGRGLPGWLAVGLALLSPLLWAQAASAFTDPPMVALALLAVERAQTNRPVQAGLAFALALLAKPTALFLAPLVLLTLAGRPAAPPLDRFLSACALPLLLAWAWDASRQSQSWWVLGAQAYGSLGEPAALGRVWAGVTWASLGWLTLIGAASALWGWRLRHLHPMNRERGESRDGWRLALGGTMLLWVPAHMLLGFQPWERYLLPLVPLAALLWAEAMPLRALGLSPPRPRVAPPTGATVRLAPPSVPAVSMTPLRRGRVRYPSPRLYLLGMLAGAFILLMPTFAPHYDLEPHDGAWEGIAALGQFIEGLPEESVVYYVDLGRPLAWYAADARAALQWAGADVHALRATLARPEPRPRFLAVRAATPLPPELTGQPVVYENPFFRVLRLASR